MARRYGLPIVEDSPPAFRLPCPKLEGTLCSIYGDRPKVCRGYKCKLLSSYDAGELSIEEAIERVDVARELFERAERLTLPGTSLPDARDSLLLADKDAAVETIDPLQMELKLRLTALAFYLDKFFMNEGDGKHFGMDVVPASAGN